MGLHDEPLNFTIKENANDFENAAIEIHNSLKDQNLSEFEAQNQIMIIRELVETGIKSDDSQIGNGNVTIHIFVEQKSVTVEVRKPVSNIKLCQAGRTRQSDPMDQRVSKPIRPIFYHIERNLFRVT